MMQLKIVLFQPEIPHNTGAAIRLCAGFHAQLHLIRPLGFSINDKYLARVALGYNQKPSPEESQKSGIKLDTAGRKILPSMPPSPVVRPVSHQNMGTFLQTLAQSEQLLVLSSKARLLLPQVSAGQQVTLLFGSETQGLAMLPPAQREELEKRAVFVTIPQAKNFRCHNLSTSIAMAMYEVQRQWGFATLCQ